MKKAIFWLVAAVILAALECAPLPSMDASELSPVTLLTIEEKAGVVRIRSDTGDLGYGRTLDAALSDMQQTSAKTLYFETTQSIVFDQSARGRVMEAARCKRLRPATKVYLAENSLPEPEAAANYLKLHEANAMLGKLRSAGEKAQTPVLPTILCREGRMMLLEG